MAVSRDQIFDRVPIYMIFLGQHAQDAVRRSGPCSVDEGELVAARLRIRREEVAAVDRWALSYAATDRTIHQEALKYRDECRAAKRPMDPAVVASFTDRRIMQVAAVFADLKSQLLPQSYAALGVFIEQCFATGLHSMKPR